MNVQTKMISRDFILLFLFSVAVCTGMNLLNVIIPLFVTETLGKSAGVAGLMTTVYTIAACVSRPINGVLTDKIGRRRVMMMGIALFGLACLIAGLIPTLLLLGGCRILMGIGYSAATTACNTASTDVIPSDRISEGIGYFGMSQSVASAFGPALAAAAVTVLGNQYSLLFVTAVSILAYGLALSIGYEKDRVIRAPEQQKKGSFEQTALLPSLFQGLSLFCISCLMCFMTLYIVSLGLPASAAGGFFFVAAVLIVSIRMACSRLMNRFSVRRFLIPGYLLLIVTCVTLPHIHSAAGVLAAGALYGAAYGTIWMALGSEAVRYAPPEKRGMANATFYFAFDAAIGLGAAFWGMMIDRIGYHNCFYSISACAAVLAVLCAIAFRRRDGSVGRTQQ